MKRVFLITLVACVGCTSVKEQPRVIESIRGVTMGVVPYSVKVVKEASGELKPQIDSLLTVFNNSLSTYVTDSEISILNKEYELSYQTRFFYPVLAAAAKVFEQTGGAFDPTVGPLVNQWGFGPGKLISVPDSALVDSLMNFAGFKRVQFDEHNVSMSRGMYLDFGAIAKGYAVDLVADYIEDLGHEDFMVEIGGEVRCSGIKPNGSAWTIGIEDPTVQRDERKLAAKVLIKDLSMATSGNYRNFFERDGKKYAHTISPFTGYPVEHSLLSATVFHKSCMLADAYATAFMVLGFEESKKIIDSDETIEGHLIYSDSSGQIVSYTSEKAADIIILD